MPWLDAKTILFAMGLVSLTMSIRMMFVAWRRKSYPGFFDWTLSFLLIGLCLISMSLHDLLPHRFALVIAHTGILMALFLVHHGLIRFQGLVPVYLFDGVLVGVFLCTELTFYYWIDLVQIRSLAFSLCAGAASFRCGCESRHVVRSYPSERFSFMPHLFMGLTGLAVLRAVIIPWHPELYYQNGSIYGGFQSATVIIGVLVMIIIEMELMLVIFRRVEASYRDAEEKYRHLIENVKKDYYLYTLDRDGCFTYLSPSSQDLMEMDIRDAIGKNWRHIFEIPGECLARIERIDALCLEGRIPDPVEILFDHPVEGQVCIETQKQPMFDRLGKVVGIEGIAKNITKRRKIEQELLRLATTDSLTGALNRGEFLRRAQTELVRCRRDRTTLCVLLLDADHFKHINDEYGHDVGDMVLSGLVQTCFLQLRPYDLFCRFGGEEFAVLLPRVRLDDAMDVGHRLVRAVESLRLPGQGKDVTVTVSIGVAEMLPKEVTLPSILKRADKAMYDAKRAGRNCVKAYVASATSSEEMDASESAS